MKYRKYAGLAIKLLGIILFAYILSTVDLGHLYSIYSGSSPVYLLLLTLALAVVVLLSRALKWTVLLKAQGIRLHYLESLRLLCVTGLVSSILPGRLGEVIRIYYIKKKGSSLGASAVSVIIDRMQDTVVLLIFGLMGVVYFSAILGQAYLMVFMIVGAFLVSVAFLSHRKLRAWAVSFVIRYLLPKKIRNWVEHHTCQFLSEISKVSLGTLILTSTMSLAIWCIPFAYFYLAAHMLDIGLSFIVVVMLTSIVTLVTALPISFSGVGTRDAVMLLIFAELGYSSAQAVAFSGMFLLVYVYFAVAGLIGILAGKRLS